MRLLKAIVSTALCAAMILPAAVREIPVCAEGKSMDIVIDGSKAELAENKRYRGAGMVSGNNSSRLLLDYKSENPDAYWEILNYLFSDKGVGINHLKLEMGSDVNSSSGTEPCVMRTETEKADVTRGAGYQLAADALTINPDLTLDMLYWSEPLWVTNSNDVYAARYKWYKETLDAAFETYGLEFEYVSAVRNERGIDTEWVKYLSKSLKAETDCPYDYSSIKIVAADEVCSWSIADMMLSDSELLEAVDVVGSHYTSWSSSNAQLLADEYGKELWFSEASSPMSYAQGTYKYDGTGSGMSDINGVLDVANRIITMYPGGDMTLYEYQPAVSAYYDGVTYCQKHLIVANEPWSGSYYLDSGYYMSLHFSQFIKKGWAFIDDACYADGVAGGDGHAIVDATYSFMTAADTETGDYSTVITNTTAEPITYNFTVRSLEKASSNAYVWETRGPEGGAWNENYLRMTETITPVENSGSYTYSVTVKPYSMVTVSTVEHSQSEYEYKEQTSEILALPYTDDFEYKDYPKDYLSSRGNAPRYTTDEGGAFEVQNVNGNNVLMQMITPDIKAEEWGYTPNPTTNFGDDRWYNYSISADVQLTKSDTPEENYAGIGLRYNLASSAESGYWVRIYENGAWKLNNGSNTVAEGILSAFDSSKWHNLKIQAVDSDVTAWIDGTEVGAYSGTPSCSAGRGALYSSWNNNCFDNIAVEPVVETEPYITRFDNTDSAFSYTGNWTHNTMSSFSNYKRTISEGTEGAVMTFTFNGTGFALTGAVAQSGISVKLDGETVADNHILESVGNRAVTYEMSGLESKEHSVEVTVLSGTFAVDGAQVTGMPVVVTSDKNKGSADTAKNNMKKIIPYAVAGGALILAAIGITAAAIIKRKRKK